MHMTIVWFTAAAEVDTALFLMWELHHNVKFRWNYIIVAFAGKFLIYQHEFLRKIIMVA